MPFHWQSTHTDVQQCGIDDMVLLSNVDDSAIVDNLRKRYNSNIIFTYIGPVLVSVNPFKEMPYFTEKEIEQYQGAAQYDNPPHIYALADNMFKNMMIDSENQCVIISGESGAGKTVCAKYIMGYISRVSGGGHSQQAQRVKDIILESNPLLEAFGNAKTGKYVELMFKSGEPVGGNVKSFLLEKSRVVGLNNKERNFHIFYQLCAGASKEMKESLGLTTGCRNFHYLNQSACSEIEGIDDRKELLDTMNAMTVIGLPEENVAQVLRLVAAILHLGNIDFAEMNHTVAGIVDENNLDLPSVLLGLATDALKTKLLSHNIGMVLRRHNMEEGWHQETETIDFAHNPFQARRARDALAKALYARLFDYLVKCVNNAMLITERGELLILGVLDIYGFEIFQKNGFEQFCINYVNEKLQQIFIQLTLKAEQEEYVQEGIAWKKIEYFNNKIVCDLIESKIPPGMFSMLDDTCIRMNAMSDGLDEAFLVTVSHQYPSHEHFHAKGLQFIMHHYAGQVTYSIDGFADKNMDRLYPDFIRLMQSSDNAFIVGLFPDVQTTGAKKQPTTAGKKITAACATLVTSLMRCAPHYVRCIKPNETKMPLDWEQNRVKFQVEYLGLRENVRVRRAGFVYRRTFDKFLKRYSIVHTPTFEKIRPALAVRPRVEAVHERHFPKLIHNVMAAVNMDSDEYQLGKTKVFIKNPKSLCLLEEVRERKFDTCARLIQKTFRRYNGGRHFGRMKEEASDLFFNKKQRRRQSINRNFVSDYIGLENNAPGVLALVGKRERVFFAHTVQKYDRKFKTADRDLVLTGRALFLIGREKVAKGPEKGKVIEVIKRRIQFASILDISLSTRHDDFFVIHVKDEYDSLLETVFKTEFLTALDKLMKEGMGRPLKLIFKDKASFTVKKARWQPAGLRYLQFTTDAAVTRTTLVAKGKSAVVHVPNDGLPANTRPTAMSSTSRAPAQRQQKPKPKSPPTHPPQCRALYDYETEEGDELAFKSGDVIDVLSEDASGWWTGKINGREGVFPANYVEKL